MQPLTNFKARRKAFVRTPHSRLVGLKPRITRPDNESTEEGTIIAANAQSIEVTVTRGHKGQFTQTYFFRRDSGTLINGTEPLRIDTDHLLEVLPEVE